MAACDSVGMSSHANKTNIAVPATADLVGAVLTHYPEVATGYLFGSAATGKQGPLSDVDVAILLSDVASPGNLAGQIQDALCRKLRTDGIDLVVLNEAPVALAYRVIRDGRCVHCRDDRLRLGFMTRTILRYLDFKPVRDQAFRVLRRKILEAA